MAAETRTGVIATALTKNAILAALRNRHVFANEDRNLRIIGTINGKLAGSRLQGAEVPAAGSELGIEISITDPDEPTAFYTINVYTDHVGGDVADVVAQLQLNGDSLVDIDGITYDGGQQYYVFKILQTDDDGVIVDKAWIAPVWIEPDGDFDTSVGPQLTLEVNEELEEAHITNIGDGDANLNGWTLVSTVGDQAFRFQNDQVLAPGESVVVTSGPNAMDQPPSFIRWTDRHVWSNSGDPGELRDPDGVIRAETR